MKSVNDSLRYRRFINERDKYLEELLRKAILGVNDDYKRFMRSVKDSALIAASYSKPGDLVASHQAISGMQSRLKQDVHYYAVFMYQKWTGLNQKTYALGYAGEAQALVYAGARPNHRKLSKIDILTNAHKDTELGSILSRIHLALNRQIRKCIDAFEMGISMGEESTAIVDRVMNAFPAPQYYKTARAIPRLREAGAQKKDDPFNFDWLEDGEWDSIVSEYNRTYNPEIADQRTQYAKAYNSKMLDDDGVEKYGWQVENEMTEDFIQKVRDGENDAANTVGITKFVWIAIVDKSTDECCLWRDGLTTDEIKDKLDGERADDECRAIAPKAHYGCRCRLAGASDDLPEQEPSNAAEFEEWLNG